MKKKAIRITKSAFSFALALCMLFSCVIQSGAAEIQSESTGYDIGGSGVKLYFVNTKAWTGVNMYYWGSGWNNNAGLTQISNTGVYYYSFSSKWTGLSGFLLNQSANDWTNKTGDVKASFSSNSWLDADSTTLQTNMLQLNGTAKVISMIDSGSGTYSETSNSNCVATISSINITSGATSTSATSGSTGSSSSAECYPAYGATVTYTASASNGYEFMGFYESNSSSLPTSGKNDSGSTRVSVGYKDSSNLSTWYAYFKKSSYKINIGTVSNGSVSSDKTTATSGTTVTLTTSPKTGYNDVKPTVKTSGGTSVTVTKTANNKYTFTMPADNVTVTDTFTAKSYTITYKDQGNATFSGTHASGYPTTHTYGTKTTLKNPTKSGYTFGGWFTNSNCTGTALTELSATGYTANITLYAKWTVANTPLAAPTNVTLSSSTVTASPGTNVTLSWSAVTNAGSYKIYKGTSTTPVATVTSTSYSIAAKYSNAGTYYVVASPSDTASYSDSEKSTGVTLTVNKTQLPAPTVSISPIDIKNGASTTATFSNYKSDLSSYISGGYATLTRGTRAYGATSGAYTTNTAVTSTTGSETLSPTSDIQYGYYMAVTTEGAEYYTQSGNSNFFDVKVYDNPGYRIAGESNFIGSNTWSYADGKEISNYVSDGVYYFVSKSVGSGDHYFKFYDSSEKGYSGDSDTNNDYTITLGDNNKVALVANDSKSFKVNGTGVFTIFFDVNTNKIWVTQNTWAITPHIYYQSYNLATDSYNTAEQGTTGGTISPEDETILVNKNSSVTLTASPKSGYTFAGWYSSSSFTGTALSTATSYTYTPTSSGEVYALFKENIPTHYTISVATVENAVVRATYNGTTHQEGSSFSAPKGASIVLYCVADTGYQAVLSPSVVAPNYSFTVSANTTVTATVTKINYALTGVVSPVAPNSATGTIKFYSDPDCTTEITTATYQQTFYAKYAPPSEYYKLDSFTIVGTGSSRTSTSGNIGTFEMGYANATVTANVVAATPTFGACPNMEAYIGESFTYTGATLATLPNSTLKYTFQGTTNTTGIFPAPSTAGTYTLTITATNQPTGITTAATATKNVTITVKYREKNVTYYVDMHNNDMTGKTVEVAIVSNAGGGTVLQYGNNQYYKSTLTKQGSSTVYAETVATPATKSGSNYNSIYVRVKYGTVSKVVSLSSTDATALMNSSSPEVWIEAKNEAGNTFKLTYATNSNTAVESGKKRIYVAKPYGWQDTEPSWKNLRLYHWGDYTDIGWDNTPKMNYIGHDSNYHYYYVDVASNVNNIIFQGWEDNSSSPNVQTGNIENIGSSNYFVLSKDGGSYVGTKGDNATVPGYTRYVDSVAMNVEDTANISPTHTGAKVTYTSSSSNVTVSSAGVVSATASATATITVKIFGTVGAKVTSANPADMMQYTVNVSVRNPGVFNGYKLMSFAHQEYTLTIPKVSNTQPGYFVLDDTSVTVNGLYDGSAYTASYANSAIIKSTATVNVSGVGTMPTSFTVKYAASNSSKGYANITLNDATVVTKSIRITEGQRYGFSKWNPDQASVSQSKIIDNNGVETVTHKGFAFTSGTSTYQAVFAPYTYVDVTFTFKYDEYVPRVVHETEMVNGVEKVVRTITNYQYESDWASQSGSHTTKTYVVPDFEVRGYNSSSVTTAVLATEAAKAIEVLPENNYYTYSITAANITKTKNGTYKANATVNLTKSLRKYKVYLNGNLNGSDYTYQAYADLNTGSTVSKWYAVDSSNATNTSNSPLLATGTGYKFRVKGDTYLRTVSGSIADNAFNRSENGFSHYEVTHKGDTAETMKEYLLQNFYIADFFDKDKVKDLTRDDTPKADEANFVGGGVVYYSMNGVTESSSGTPYSKAVDAGYVNSDGTINADEVKAMLKRNIEANYSNYASLAAAIGEEDAMKVVYGQKIDVTNHKENGTKTGVLYRYLPLENYSVDANNNITTTLNSDVFRYSNSLQSYQYVYASGNENKATNNGKNMRLYSYFIYSYLSYDKDTNLPQTKYEVVLSDQYSDASTYWDGN